MQMQDPFRIGKLEETGKMLLLGNIIGIVFAIVFNYNFAIVIWSYFFESIIVGLFTVLTILATGIRHWSAIRTAISMAGFFAFHYGFFHLVYFIFLALFTFGFAEPGTAFYLTSADFPWIALTAGVLFLGHGFSFVTNSLLRKEEVSTDPKKKIESIFIRPYSRIIPMHLTIIASGFFAFFLPFSWVFLVIFMGLKTMVDLAAHQYKHGFIKN